MTVLFIFFFFYLFIYFFYATSTVAAIQALKRKKRFEKQLKQIDGTLSMIELQREALEGAKTNAATITTMKQASDAMKAVQKDLYVQKIDRICFDIIIYGIDDKYLLFYFQEY